MFLLHISVTSLCVSSWVGISKHQKDPSSHLVRDAKKSPGGLPGSVKLHVQRV